MELGEMQKKWVEALRSGDYRQGAGWLYRNGKHCCLGVACEVLIQNGLPMTRDEDLGYSDARETHECVLLPEMARQAIGLRTCEGMRDSDCGSLAEMNDSDVKFSLIADAIEAEPHEWFEVSK